MFADVGHGGRQPHRDASGRRPGRPARADRHGHGPVERATSSSTPRAGKPGAGLVAQTIQFHGTADRYTLGSGAEALATLYSDASTATSNPAVTLRSVGSSGGQAAAFTYDLARSIVYTRQGNPAWAGDDRDASVTPAAIIRSDDLFYGAKPGDSSRTGSTLSKVQIPQADEQQRLLVNLIEQMNLDKKPLPEVLVLPARREGRRRHDRRRPRQRRDERSVRLGRTSVRPANCSVADWDCVRQHVVHLSRHADLRTPPRPPIRRRDSRSRSTSTRTARTGRPTSLEGFYADQLAPVRRGLPEPRDARDEPHPLHHVERLGDAAARSSSATASASTRTTTTGPTRGSRTGPATSPAPGMPMRFADLDGSMIDVYQATTQMTDESGITYSTHINTLLDNAIGAPGYYGVVTANMHTDNPNHPGQQTIVNAAIARGVPVVSAQQMLTWLDGRNGSSFGSLSWAGNSLKLHDRRRLGRERPAGDGPDDVGGRRPHRHHPQRVAGHVHDADDQGHRSTRSSRRRREAIRRPTPSTPRLRPSARSRPCRTRTEQPPSPGRRTSPRRLASTTAPPAGP